MKYPENIYPRVTRFERQTGCCPLILATLILDQLKNYFWTELPDDLADEVAQKAEIVFAGNARWRRKFKGPRGREYLIMFMRHWFSAALFQCRSPLFRQLPEDFKIGRPLPPVSLPRQLEQALSKKTHKNLKTRRARSDAPHLHFVHGCELLAI